MRRRATCAVIVTALALTGFTSGAMGATKSPLYECTETITKGGVGYGVVFAGSNEALLRKGCAYFARGTAFRIQWGVHRPTGWVVSAEYVHPQLKMEALLIAPPTLKDAVFRLVNKPVFTTRGWVFVKRG